MEIHKRTTEQEYGILPKDRINRAYIRKAIIGELPISDTVSLLQDITRASVKRWRSSQDKKWLKKAEKTVRTSVNMNSRALAKSRIHQADIMMELGEQHVAQHLYKQAISLLQYRLIPPIINLFTYANLQFAEICMAKKQFKEMEEPLSTAISVLEREPANERPNDFLEEAYLYLGYAKHNLGKFRDAVEYLNKLVELCPNDARGHHYRAYAKYMIVKPDGLPTGLDKAMEPETRCGFYEVLVDLDNAIGPYKEQPQSAEMEIILSDLLQVKCRVMRSLKRMEDALSSINESILLNPNDAKTWCLRGLLKKTLKDSKGALHDLNRSIELDPEDAINYIGCGDVEYDMGAFSKASEDYGKAIKILEAQPSNKPPACVIYFNNSTPTAEDIQPNNTYGDEMLGEAYLGMAETMLALGKHKSALSFCNKLLKLNPENDSAYRLRAETKDALLDIPGAKKDRKTAEKIRQGNK